MCAHSAFRPNSENLFLPQSSKISGTGLANRWTSGFQRVGRLVRPDH